MRLRVLLPARVEVDCEVRKVSAEAEDGAFTLLPRHVDFAAALKAGLLSFLDEEGNETFLGVDGGVLVKIGSQVLVSTPRAVRGPELGRLREQIERQFEHLDEQERKARSALGRMETDFMRRLMELDHA
jgi:F-type H+-transporting ATPase subunit epsilon